MQQIALSKNLIAYSFANRLLRKMREHTANNTDELSCTNDALTQVVADEMMTDQFGSFAWPSSRILRAVLTMHQDSIIGKTVLELGCGIGVDGIFASKLAKWVYLTDLEDPPSILDNCRRNCEKDNCENTTVVRILDFIHFSYLYDGEGLINRF